MTDSAALRDIIGKTGLKYRFIAEQLNLSPYGLAKKIDNKNEFKASEIVTLSDLLCLSERTQMRIFFSKT